MKADRVTADDRYRRYVEDGSRVGETESEPMRGLCQQIVEDVSTYRIEQVANDGAETLFKWSRWHQVKRSYRY
jgi:hypothetical protein